MTTAAAEVGVSAVGTLDEAATIAAIESGIEVVVTVSTAAPSSVPTVDGAVDLNVPAGTQPATTMRIEGKGAPKLNNVNLRGTHFLKVNVQIPRSLSSEERELVMQLKQASS